MMPRRPSSEEDGEGGLPGDQRGAPTAEALVAEWMRGSETREKPGPGLLFAYIARRLEEPLDEEHYALLSLPRFRWIRRWQFRGHYRAALYFLWHRAAIERLGGRSEVFLARCRGYLESNLRQGGRRVARWEERRPMLSALADNVAEEGYFGVAHLITMRLLGGVRGGNDLRRLEGAVLLAMDLEAQYDRFREML
ncbi:MAG: hypothetical protein HQL57_09555 [Magnetococcales bacterium]|nr:hypothetical protein [Magnetococcales bacterium]